jgi:DNA primase
MNAEIAEPPTTDVPLSPAELGEQWSKELIRAHEQILELNPIEEIVGQLVTLTPDCPKGKKLRGACPFNPNHARSLTVHPRNGVWRCWSCRREGDVVAFVGFRDNLDWLGAFKKLAAQSGVTLPQGC